LRITKSYNLRVNTRVPGAFLTLWENVSPYRKEFNMSKLKTSIAALVIAALPALALAQATPATPATPNIDKRQAEQQKRIDQGVKSGQLTPREAAKLEKGQAKVQRMEDKAKADGVVTPKERAQITREQDKQSRRIAREKHNAQHK
jgi:hypothetical protein